MYKGPIREVWSGRVDSTTDHACFRYHQIIKTWDLKDNVCFDKNEKNIVLIGFESEEGVRRNNGRLGTAKAPNAIRQSLAKLSWHGEQGHNLFDGGTVICENSQLEKAQDELGRYVSKVLKERTIPIILGGGHETAYGHYLGVRDVIGNDVSLGIINIDAHFDMRPYDQKKSSGTMFKQILDEDEKCKYLVLGIQKFGNTKALFNIAAKYGCTYILEEELDVGISSQVKEAIDDFIISCDYILLTLCMDSIGACYAPGVSAPSPFGLNPKGVRDLIRYVVNKKNVLSFDISEVNPVLDEGGRTVNLAANLVNESIMRMLNRKIDKYFICD